MHRSGVGPVAIAAACFGWGGLLAGCVGSPADGGGPSGSGGATAASGGASAVGSGGAGVPVLGTGGSGGTTALTGGAPGQTGGAPGQTGGAVGTGGAAGEPGGPRGGATATGGRAAPSGGAGGMGAAGAPGSPGGAGTDPGNAGDGDFVIMPPYASAVKVTNVPHSTKFSMQTSASKVYPGAARPIVVYIHKQYVDGTEAPFIIITDGNAPAAGSPEIVTAAENHYQDTDPATRIPPQVFIFVPPGANRSVEYDTVSDAYSRFINTEVLPLVESNADIKAVYPNFKLTTNPDGRAAYGCSSGSPAAMGLAWFSNFHRVVSYSGTFVALQATADHPLGAWEYPAMILAAPPKPLRVFLEVGEMDNGYTTTEAGHHNWVIGNRNMAAALKTQGYHYRFLFAMGAGHCDGSVKSKTYSETLSWVWRGYAAN